MTPAKWIWCCCWLLLVPLLAPLPMIFSERRRRSTDVEFTRLRFDVTWAQGRSVYSNSTRWCPSSLAKCECVFSVIMCYLSFSKPESFWQPSEILGFCGSKTSMAWAKRSRTLSHCLTASFWRYAAGSHLQRSEIGNSKKCPESCKASTIHNPVFPHWKEKHRPTSETFLRWKDLCHFPTTSQRPFRMQQASITGWHP